MGSATCAFKEIWELSANSTITRFHTLHNHTASHLHIIRTCGHKPRNSYRSDRCAMSHTPWGNQSASQHSKSKSKHVEVKDEIPRLCCCCCLNHDVCRSNSGRTYKPVGSGIWLWDSIRHLSSRPASSGPLGTYWTTGLGEGERKKSFQCNSGSCRQLLKAGVFSHLILKVSTEIFCQQIA